ncbi:MAG: hypothetical protein ACIAQZ_05350 [Sedimentisphaeraceae bacterium JB056]
MKCGYILLLLSASSVIAGYGVLSAVTGQMEGTGVWIDGTGIDNWTPATLEWNVSKTVDGVWHYEYTLNVYRGNVSHFILETSINFDVSDIFNIESPGSSIEIGSFTPGPGNPYMPGDIYGIKFDDTAGTALTLKFDSYRSPVWGDFYAKDGNAGDEITNTICNSGFLAADPTLPITDISVTGHLPTPDTVPEPSTFALLATSCLYVCTRRKL